MPQFRPKVLRAWRSGKDSVWVLHGLRQSGDVGVCSLLTTINQEFAREAMHGVRPKLVNGQARMLDLPLANVPIPWPCSNADYENAMRTALDSPFAVSGVSPTSASRSVTFSWRTRAGVVRASYWKPD